ncbi:hypothetical protein [Chryseobacterium potabilaquae]|nr:hypothetical protein [Chryseobacterium potabilaquae]
MKKIIFIILLSIGGFIFSQVGINNISPESTLDIAAKNTTGSANQVEGLLVPRIDRERAQTMNNVPISTIIYVNNITTGSQSGTAQYIDDENFYYFDGIAWQKLVTPPASEKIFAVVTKNATQTIPHGSNHDITWQTITGTNVNSVSLSGGNITLPPNKVFLLQGYVAWLSSSSVSNGKAWIKYQFVSTSNQPIGSVHIAGFQEASTEEIKDGGVNPATVIIHTGASPLIVKLATMSSGGDGSESYNLSYGTGNTGTCYVLIQEL